MIEIEEIKAGVELGWLDMRLFSATKTNLTKREIEQKGSLFLLAKMLKTEGFNLNYDAFNKPFLMDRREHISISHSHDWLVIAISKNANIGVDVELIREKVLNIKDKFLTELESNFAKDHTVLLTLIWSAKEAIYKAYGKKNVEFKNIAVDPFILKEEGGTMSGNLKIDKRYWAYKMIYKIRKDYVLVLTTEEDEV